MSSNSYYWIDNTTIRLGEVGNTVYELNPIHDGLRVKNANGTNATMIVDGTIVADRIQTPALLPQRVIATDDQSRLVHSTITIDQLNEFDDNILQLQQTIVNKQDTITGGATSIITSNLNPSLIMTSDPQGKVAVTSIPRNELESYPQRIADLENAGIDLSLLQQNVLPKDTNTYDIGSVSKQWNNIYVSNVHSSGANIEYLRVPNIETQTGNIHIDGNVFVTGTIQTPDGVVDFEAIESNVISTGHKILDLGKPLRAWRDLYASNAYTNYIQPLDASNVTVDGDLIVKGVLIGQDGQGIVPDPDWTDVMSSIEPSTDTTYDLGRYEKRWSNVWTTGIVSGGDDLTIYGNLILTSNLLGPDGNVFKDLGLTSVTTDVIPETDGNLALGASDKKWINVWAGNIYGNVDVANLYGELSGNLEIEGALIVPSVYADRGSLLYPSYTFIDKQEAGVYLEANNSYLGISLDGQSGVRIGNANVQIDHDVIITGNIVPTDDGTQISNWSLGTEANIWNSIHANIAYVESLDVLNDIVIGGSVLDIDGNPIQVDLTNIQTDVIPAYGNLFLGTLDVPWDEVNANGIYTDSLEVYGDIVIGGSIIDVNGNPVQLDLTNIESDVVSANTSFSLGTVDTPWAQAYVSDFNVDNSITIGTTSLDSGGNLYLAGTMTGGIVPWSRLTDIPSASTVSPGTVQLSTSITSTSTTTAATSSAIKDVNDNTNTRALQSTTITAGTGLTGGGSLATSRTISHADTSSQPSINNSGGNVIQDITLDGFGHVTGLGTYNLDDRYYTETESNTLFLSRSGGTLNGNLNITGSVEASGASHIFGTGGRLGISQNDGQGNLNLTFNHDNGGIPEQNGSSSRIVSAVDSSTAALIFELVDNVTSGVIVNTNEVMRATTSGVDVTGTLTTTGAATLYALVVSKAITCGSISVASSGYLPIAYIGSTTRGLSGVTGDYGTIQTTGTGAGSWAGYSIDGNFVFMGNGTSCGLYDDTINQWIMYYTNKTVDLRYSGAVKLATTGSGVTVTGSMSATGDVTAYASDRRLKTNIVKLQDALGKIKKINGYTYTWRDDIENLEMRGDDIGLIAQELEEAGLHECVVLAPFDNDEGTSKSGNEYKTIHYNKLHALWAEAFKEQQKVIDHQQSLIDAQNAMLQEQRARIDKIERMLSQMNIQ